MKLITTNIHHREREIYIYKKEKKRKRKRKRKRKIYGKSVGKRKIYV